MHGQWVGWNLARQSETLLVQQPAALIGEIIQQPVGQLATGA